MCSDWVQSPGSGDPFPDGRVGGLISRVTVGEQLCREYALAAPAGIFGELAGSVGSGVITDPAQRATIEVDVAVLGAQAPGELQRVLSLGEAN
jgi:hypothetical protein